MQTALRRCLLTILFLTASLSVVDAANVVQASRGTIGLGPYLEVFVDPTQNNSIEQIRREPNWASNELHNSNFGFSHATYWLHFRVSNDLFPASEFLLELRSPVLDEVVFYQYHNNQLIQNVETGARLPAAQRNIQHRNFLFPVTIGAGQTHEFYVKVRSATSIQTPLTLWSQKTFWEQDQQILIIHGLYYGAMLFMIFYNFVLYLRLSERSYLIYMLNVVSFLLIQLWIDGLGLQMLWPHHPQWNEGIPVLIPPVTIVCIFMLLKRMLKLEEMSPVLNRWASLNVVAAIVGFLAGLLLPEIALAHAPVLFMFAAASALIISYTAWLRTRKIYVFSIAISSTAFLLSVISVGLTDINILPHTSFSDFTLIIGSSIEMFMLSYALSERLSEMNQQRLSAEHDVREIGEKLLESARQHGIDLDRKVEQRTQELTLAVANVERLNRQLSELSITDPLTGVKNRRFFDEKLAQELQRARRRRTTLSLIMIDVDHFKNVNDTYGHPAGDKCLRILTEAIHRELRRPPDELCRIGGEELAVILPDTAKDGALNVAERIRWAIQELLIQSGNHQFRMTASLGVACETPFGDTEISDLMTKADRALYEAKNSGRNRVCYQP